MTVEYGGEKAANDDFTLIKTEPVTITETVVVDEATTDPQAAAPSITLPPDDETEAEASKATAVEAPTAIGDMTALTITEANDTEEDKPDDDDDDDESKHGSMPHIDSDSDDERSESTITDVKTIVEDETVLSAEVAVVVEDAKADLEEVSANVDEVKADSKGSEAKPPPYEAIDLPERPATAMEVRPLDEKLAEDSLSEEAVSEEVAKVCCC